MAMGLVIDATYCPSGDQVTPLAGGFVPSNVSVKGAVFHCAVLAVRSGCPTSTPSKMPIATVDRSAGDTATEKPKLSSKIVLNSHFGSSGSRNSRRYFGFAARTSSWGAVIAMMYVPGPQATSLMDTVLRNVINCRLKYGTGAPRSFLKIGIVMSIKLPLGSS